MAGNQAAFLDGPGQKLRIAPVDMPQAGRGEIVIRHRAAAVNPLDWKVQQLGIMVQEWPTVLGLDVAGEVVAVGDDVDGTWKVGDRVVARMDAMHAPDNHHAAFQLYGVAHVATAAKIPAGISFADAAVLPVAFDTAVIGLSDGPGKGLGLPAPTLDATPTPSGKLVVIWGGSSAVGAQATQLAALAGVDVITVSSARNFGFCKANGAGRTFDHGDAAVVDKIVDAIKASGRQFGGVFDCIGEPSTYGAAVAIAQRLGGGRVAVTVPGQPDPPAGVETTHVFGLGPFTHPFWKDFITPALQQGKLRCLPEPLVVGTGLDVLQDAFDLQKKGVSAKKVVVLL